MIDVYIVGSKGIPAKYGGFETFVDNLVTRQKSEDINYFVTCMNNNEGEYDHNGSRCIKVKLPLQGSPGRLLHVSRALKIIEKKIEISKNKSIVYILGCRIGPLLIPHSKKLRKLGTVICCNPDGLEWKRNKWNFLEKRIIKLCESCLVKYSDISICDSLSIETYIKQRYSNVKTTYIAYGSDVNEEKCDDKLLDEWLQKYKINRKKYYLVVGRFVPENNYRNIIKGFINSNTSKDLVIITNAEKNKFYTQLYKETEFYKDKRIKFVGTVYDGALLKAIRQQAYAYIHGHEVGGTNPSLLEALASTDVNLVLDVCFNREVCKDSAFYWNNNTTLSNLIDETDLFDDEKIMRCGNASKKAIINNYSWNKIVCDYEKLFKSLVNE